jgi:hypothetical protein
MAAETEGKLKRKTTYKALTVSRALSQSMPTEPLTLMVYLSAEFLRLSRTCSFSAQSNIKYVMKSAVKNPKHKLYISYDMQKVTQHLQTDKT